MGRAYGLRVSDLATMIASLAHLSGNLTPANDYIMDEMINLFIYLSLHTNSTLTVPMTKNLEK